MVEVPEGCLDHFRVEHAYPGRSDTHLNEGIPTILSESIRNLENVTVAGVFT